MRAKISVQMLGYQRGRSNVKMVKRAGSGEPITALYRLCAPHG